MSIARSQSDPVAQARVHMAAGRTWPALTILTDAMAAAPDDPVPKKLFVQWIHGLAVVNHHDMYERAVTTCLADQTLMHAFLFMPWLSLLRRRPHFAFLNLPGQADVGAAAPEAFIADAMRDPLLLAGLPVLTATHARLEILLTRMRRHCLLAHSGEEPFLSALALHCHRNEYAFYVEDDERAALCTLQTGIETDPAAAGYERIALYACYSPLAALSNPGALRDADRTAWPVSFRQLVRVQLDEPLCEETLKKAIPVLTPVGDPVSQKVRAQYEQNPYPRWTSWQNPRAAFDPKGHSAGKEILNAGCGTGFAPIGTAFKFPRATVHAVDLSLASLAYARRKAEELGVHNILFAQADILELHGWEKRFDVIMSGGVLHHMDRPLAGWRVLRDLLKPGGVMRVALYSEAGRADIVRAQKWIVENGIPATEDGIRSFRRAVMALSDGDPVRRIMGMRDFYTLSDCRDLAFHVMEHRFTCRGLQDALDDLGMAFLGFDVPAPVRQSYRTLFPDDPALRNLDNWQQYEDAHPQTFLNMYKFWCCRAGERPQDDIPAWLTAPQSG